MENKHPRPAWTIAAAVLVTLAQFAPSQPAKAAERRPDAATLHTLTALGCRNVPEEGPRAMNCGSDTGYFLCDVFQKLGKPLECSGAATPAIPNLDRLSDDHFLHKDLPRIAERTPCAIWAYPEDDAIKTGAGRRCALQVLKALHCTTTPGADAKTTDIAAAKTSAMCPKPEQHTCASLQEASLIDRCGP